jgi:hypothetical protein
VPVADRVRVHRPGAEPRCVEEGFERVEHQQRLAL